ncbi:hypothetical protein HID58_077932 [Brassica napus]|uniref:C2H2-type domain-containing protein n=1 Tax=Brassica napus TaxID=3708 RepID=A0ABQ7YRQ3_BRANA|nr:hypothetical protein HID58_077932 [Brassica napus]
MPVLLTSAECSGKSLLSGACFLFVLSCVTKTWARNYPATPEHATAEIHVWWDMKDCPIPEGYDARRVLPSIESAFKEIGYSGPVSITAFADQKETPDHHLLLLVSSTESILHIPFPVRVLHSRMITDCEEWIEDNPAPATVMIISDELASPKSHSSLLCRKLQESNYNCFWLIQLGLLKSLSWSLLLSGSGIAYLQVSETKRQTLQKGCESESESDVEFTGMFYCDLCDSDCESLDDFKKHLSSKEHTHEVGYPPKTKRMRKAPRKGFLPRSLRFTRRCEIAFTKVKLARSYLPFCSIFCVIMSEEASSLFSSSFTSSESLSYLQHLLDSPGLCCGSDIGSLLDEVPVRTLSSVVKSCKSLRVMKFTETPKDNRVLSQVPSVIAKKKGKEEESDR